MMQNDEPLKLSEKLTDQIIKQSAKILNKQVKIKKKFESSDSFSFLLVSEKKEKYVVKVNRFPNWPPEGKLDQVFNLLTYAKIDHEEVIFSTHKNISFVHGWQISKFIDGGTIRDKMDEPKFNNKSHYKKIGLFFSKLHKIKGSQFHDIDSQNKFSSFQEKEISILEQNQLFIKKTKDIKLFEKAMSEIVEMLSSFNFSSQSSLIHNDMNPRNILWNNGNLLVIDWADAQFNLPIKDFAAVTFRIKSNIVPFLEEGYGQKIDRHELYLHQMIRFVNLAGFFYFEDHDIEAYDQTVQLLQELINREKPFGT